ncbi:MAG: hypothetical protein AAFY34_03250 [Pseudomonadota bacterium]
MKRLFVGAFVFTLIGCTSIQAESNSETNSAISVMMLADETRGRWTSVACELRPQPYQEGQPVQPFHLKRDFTYDDNLFEGTIVSYLDPLCQVPIVSYTFTGHLVSHGASPAAPGAEKTDYVLDRSLILTPKAQAFADQLNLLPAGICGTESWRVDVSQSIKETGCPVLNLEKGEIYIDHDIMYVDGDFLFFGAKPVDGSNFDSEEARPVQLQVPLKRVTP